MKRRYTKRSKKKKPTPELVTVCDGCDKPLRISHVRTVGSGICAAGDGCFVQFPNSHGNVRPVSRVEFFCEEKCVERLNHAR